VIGTADRTLGLGQDARMHGLRVTPPPQGKAVKGRVVATVAKGRFVANIDPARMSRLVAERCGFQRIGRG